MRQKIFFSLQSTLLLLFIYSISSVLAHGLLTSKQPQTIQVASDIDSMRVKNIQEAYIAVDLLSNSNIAILSDVQNIILEEHDTITTSHIPISPDWTAESDKDHAWFGWCVGTAGDVNGDGYSDVIVSERYYDTGQMNVGRVFVYHGSVTGLSNTPDWVVEGNQDYALFGHSVGTAGDVNGDGYSDVIVGEHLYEKGHEAEGRAFVYHGSATGLSPNPNWTAEGNQTRSNYGYYVGTAGDVNGDGYSDVIISAECYSNGEVCEGRAYVYHGSLAGLSTSPDWFAEGNQEGALFGSSVGTAGDVNGDGYSDIIVGAIFYDNGQQDEGRAYVYHGSAAGLSISPNWIAESNQAWSEFGHAVGTAGDVNGDGYSDVIVSAHRYSNDQISEGRAFVYQGSAAGLSNIPNWTAEGDQDGAAFGSWTIGTAGDVNGDGYSEVIIGALFYDNGQENEGRAFVYQGSPSGLSTIQDWTGEGNQEHAWFGFSVGTAGDVNGNGSSDIIIGAARYDDGQEDEGKVFAYYGNGSNGISLLFYLPIALR